MSVPLRISTSESAYISASQGRARSTPARVTIDSPEFLAAAVRALPRSARLAFLRAPEAMQLQPGWIEAMRVHELFAMQGRAEPNLGRSSARWLSNDEDEAIAALAWTACAPTCAARREVDFFEISDIDAIEAPGSILKWQSQWSPGLSRAFRAVVRDFLALPDLGGTECVMRANAALLLCAACAGGDVASVRDLCQHYSDLYHEPVSSALLHGERDRRILISAPLLAIQHQRHQVLHELVRAGWDPLSTLFWRDETAVIRAGLPIASDALSRGNVWDLMGQRGESRLCCGFLPKTAEFFFRHFVRCHGGEPALAGTNADLARERRSQLLELASNCASGRRSDLESLRAPLISSGLAAELGQDLILPAIEGMDVGLLAVLRFSIDWDRFESTSFPLIAVATGRGGLSRFAEHGRRDDIATTLMGWLIEDGRLDILSAPYIQHYPAPIPPDTGSPVGSGLQNQQREEFHIPHRLAAAGMQRAVMAALHGGLDPALRDFAGRSLAEAAEEGGHFELAHALRSFATRQAMLGLLDEINEAAGVQFQAFASFMFCAPAPMPRMH